MDMTIGIKLPVGEVPAKACMLIKKTTGLALGEIKERARDDEYIFECPVCDDDGLKLINSLNGELEKCGIKARLFDSGREESPELFRNLERTYGEINRTCDTIPW